MHGARVERPFDAGVLIIAVNSTAPQREASGILRSCRP
jgi:hypothetical protein